jgi:hypothetical protein
MDDGAAALGAIDDVAGAGVADGIGRGPGIEAAVLGADTGAAAGARDGVAVPDFPASGGAGIDVSPVAGPGPSGATGCTGIVVEGTGRASSRHASPSASKLRSVLRPQIGQSQPTSNRFLCASMLWAGARSRTRSGPIAKPERTWRCSSSRASSWAWHSQTLRMIACFMRGPYDSWTRARSKRQIRRVAPPFRAPKNAHVASLQAMPGLGDLGAGTVLGCSCVARDASQTSRVADCNHIGSTERTRQRSLAMAIEQALAQGSLGDLHAPVPSHGL